MPTFRIPDESRYEEKTGAQAIQQKAFDNFSPAVLGLGEIKNECVSTPAIAAFFDLQGFTIFCKQVEPHLSVPIFLNGFLNWIFHAIKKETIQKQFAHGVSVWHDLPFFTKFMGDGLLVLWDTTKMNPISQHNLILSCEYILEHYIETFLPKIRRKASDVPPVLRCGLAKGDVFSVGNGEDYVGSCINMSARLQKLGGLSIGFARRGFNPEEHWKEKKHIRRWLLKKVSVRGIGDNELIYIKESEFTKLRSSDKKLFVDP